MTTTTPANHLPCQSCHTPVRRGEAVIRGNLREQLGWHKDCFTLHRALRDVDVSVVGGTLMERLEREGVRL